MKVVQFVRLATQTAASYVGLVGQVIVDLGTFQIRVQDGVTPGGQPTLNANNNLSDLENVATARSNLGLSANPTFTGVTKTDKLWQASRNAYYSAAGFIPNPAGSNTGSPIMMGLGSSFALTPTFSGRVKIQISGFSFNTTANAGTQIGLRYGTGSPPNNGDADTGTNPLTIPIRNPSNSVSTIGFAFSLYVEITGLTLNTAYWFDIALNSIVATSTSSIQISTVLIEEF